jgi:hypothetical protein
MAAWSKAFADEAAADLDVYEHLSRSSLPMNQRLHYLQMWLEKLCKAYRYKADSNDQVNTHNVIAKVLPQLIRENWRQLGYKNADNLPDIKKLCREIDLLHPQVTDGDRRRDNVEYPWIGITGEVEVPVRWKFELASKLSTGPGRLLLKAATSLTRDLTLLSN